MANRDDFRPNAPHRQPDRWRREGGSAGERETRSFDGHGRFNSDQARYGRNDGPYDADRQDRTRGGGGYGGQAFGLEAGSGRSYPGRHDRDDQVDERATWRPSAGAPYGDLQRRAGSDSDYGPPGDYAYHPQTNDDRHDPEHDRDYLRWREQQMRSHDRDYREWRQHQHRQYDDEYGRFRAERRDTFGRNFHEWRAQQPVTTPTAPEFDKEPNQVKAATDGARTTSGDKD